MLSLMAGLALATEAQLPQGSVALPPCIVYAEPPPGYPNPIYKRVWNATGGPIVPVIVGVCGISPAQTVVTSSTGPQQIVDAASHLRVGAIGAGVYYVEVPRIPIVVDGQVVGYRMREHFQVTAYKYYGVPRGVVGQPIGNGRVAHLTLGDFYPVMTEHGAYEMCDVQEYTIRDPLIKFGTSC